MKTILKLYAIIVLSILPLVSLHAETTHWSCDTHAYEYDMAVYFCLSINSEVITDYSNYELAAFCGEECRGVAKILTVEKDGQTTAYGYLRIRSNQQEGETITFKVYVKDINREVDIEDSSITFLSQDVKGIPSNPIVFNFVPFIPGDADNSGEIDIFDAVAIVEYYLNGSLDGFNIKAADFNGDGDVDIFDAVAIVDYYLNQ